MTESSILNQVLLRYLTIEPQREILRFYYQNKVLDAMGNPFSNDCFRSFWWGLQHGRTLGLMLEKGSIKSAIVPEISPSVFQAVTHIKLLGPGYSDRDLLSAQKFTVVSSLDWLKMEHQAGQVRVWVRFRRRKKPVALAASPGFLPLDSLRDAIHRQITLTCYGYKIRGEKFINGFF